MVPSTKLGSVQRDGKERTDNTILRSSSGQCEDRQPWHIRELGNFKVENRQPCLVPGWGREERVHRTLRESTRISDDHSGREMR